MWSALAIAQSTSDPTLVVVEAERFDSSTGDGGHDWDPVSLSGASEDGALQALPNINTNHDTGFVGNSPRLDYVVDFPESGSYFVWVRGRAASNKDDSLHIGLNGAAQSRADRITGFGSDWTWSDDTMDSSRARIDVTSAGQMTLNVWMREDGFVIDKIVLTKVSSYQPSGLGPVDSPGTPAPPPPEDNTDPVVAIEIEQYTTNVGVGGHDWVAANVSGASGDGALQALPNNNTNRNSDFVVNSPRLDFDVDFPESGRYYVWVRGRGASSKDDSLHVGLNGQAEARADRITGLNSGWTWSDETMDDVRASIDVAVAGPQQVTVWMREDGTVLDKIVLAKDPSMHPTDYGPLGPSPTEPGSPPPPPPEPPDDSEYVLAVEAENFVSNVGVGGHDWVPVTPSGASGGGSLQSLPNVNENNNTGYAANSPRLDYNIDFPAAGTYYVWIRGRGRTNSDDSLHVGLNGQPQASADRISELFDRWEWTNETMDDRPATITVANAGSQVLNVWMREDGTVIDKIVLTTDASAHPEDYGPLGPPETEPAPPGGGTNPPANTPPEISGTPATRVIAGTNYSFRPTLFDADGDSLTASVSGLPRWATFNSTTGQLSGTPAPGDVGRYDNIVISVSDGQDSDALAPFSIVVDAVATGSVTLTWTPPTTNTDGSPLTDLAAYEVRWGPENGNLDQSVTLSNPGLSTYVVDNLAPGNYRFEIYAVNSVGVMSDASNAAYSSVQ